MLATYARRFFFITIMTLSKYFKVILALLLIFPLVSCGSDNEPEDPNAPNDSSKYPQELIGKWSRALNKSKTTIDSYYFLNNGKGYSERVNNSFGSGINYRGFEWNIDNNKLRLKWLADYINKTTDEDIIDYKLKDNTLTIGSHTFTHENTNGKTDFDYLSAPFNGCYFLGTYHYEISKVVATCSHGTGTQSNFKHLLFFGENGTLKPCGITVSYSTPYYEGIDNNWSEGTYRITNSSGHWIYKLFGQIGSQKIDFEEGILTIKKNGKLVNIDYESKSSYIEIHFKGIIQD